MKVKLGENKTPHIDGEFVDDGRFYSVPYLIEKSKSLKVFDLPLNHIDISRMPWTITNIRDYLEHTHRVNKADLSYPIIMDYNGQILDGWHRICLAIIKNKTTVKAVRFEYYLQPTGVK